MTDDLIPTGLIDALTTATLRRNGKWERHEMRFQCVLAERHKNADADPSARWNPVKATWCCDGCKGGGGALNLAELLNVPLDTYDARFVFPRVDEPAPAPTLAGFAARRRLPVELLTDTFEVAETQHYCSKQKRKRPALRYPTARGDRIRFIDGEKPKATWAEVGSHETLYNVGRARELLHAGQPTLFLVNGEPSVWACWTAGVPAFCLCVGEKAPSAEACQALAEVLARVPHTVRVAVIFDRDEPGQRAANDAIGPLRAAGIDALHVALPADLPSDGDVDDLHRRVGSALDDVLAALVAATETGTPAVDEATREEHAWQQILSDVELFPFRPPYYIERLWGHIRPFTVMFPDDWPIMVILPYWAALWPRIRLQNLNMAVWTLGISDQGSGKNVGTDELQQVMKRVLRDTAPSRVTLFTSGTVEGMWDALSGDDRQMIVYQDEFAGFLQMLKRDHMTAVREGLCSLYDGRPVGYVRSQEKIAQVDNPHVVVCATTTPDAFTQHADPADLKNGYLSRFMLLAPDYEQRSPDYYPSDDHRRRTLVDELTVHVRRLDEARTLLWEESGTAKDPAILEEYAAHLGLNSRKRISLDSATDRPQMPAGRLYARAKKLAGLLELAEATPHLTDEGRTVLIRTGNIESAIALVEHGRAYADRVLRWVGQSSDYTLTKKIEEFLERAPAGLDRRELCRKTKAKAAEVLTGLKLLDEAGHVTAIRGNDGRTRWVLNRTRLSPLSPPVTPLVTPIKPHVAAQNGHLSPCHPQAPPGEGPRKQERLRALPGVTGGDR